MTDPAASVDGFTDEIAGGVEVDLEPASGTHVKLAARYDGDILARGEYAEVLRGNHHGRTNRGEFVNTVEDSAESIAGLDAEEVATALDSWFDEMSEIAQEEELALQPDYVKQVIEGTHPPVEIHGGGEETTWHVELTFAGRTSELEFTASEMAGGGSGALKQKIANNYYELIDIQEADWEAIRDHWDEHSELVSEVEETGRDAIKNRFVDRLSDAVRPLEDIEQVPSDPSGAWYDDDNTAGYEEAGADEPILWVQSRLVADKVEEIGKQIEYRGQLVKDLISDDVLHGTSVQRTWSGSFERRTRMYPFKPAELGIDEDDIAPEPGDNTDEVDP